ncbi:hypothetical protein HDU96_007788 [Phlyctochytrium bullatum]|nr:hypothetical protein HDU96_007788 [Phlyctochytrium bullatum]
MSASHARDNSDAISTISVYPEVSVLTVKVGGLNLNYKLSEPIPIPGTEPQPCAVRPRAGVEEDEGVPQQCVEEVALERMYVSEWQRDRWDRIRFHVADWSSSHLVFLGILASVVASIIVIAKNRVLNASDYFYMYRQDDFFHLRNPILYKSVTVEPSFRGTYHPEIFFFNHKPEDELRNADFEKPLEIASTINPSARLRFRSSSRDVYIHFKNITSVDEYYLIMNAYIYPYGSAFQVNLTNEIESGKKNYHIELPRASPVDVDLNFNAEKFRNYSKPMPYPPIYKEFNWLIVVNGTRRVVDSSKAIASCPSDKVRCTVDLQFSWNNYLVADEDGNGNSLYIKYNPRIVTFAVMFLAFAIMIGYSTYGLVQIWVYNLSPVDRYKGMKARLSARQQGTADERTPILAQEEEEDIEDGVADRERAPIRENDL